MDSRVGARLLNAGAVGSALVASICCFGPLALALLGLGGGALLLRFVPYRPYFLGIAALFLAAAFYLTYRRPASRACEPGSVCVSAATGRSQKIALWVVAAVVAIAAAFPLYAPYLF